MTTLEKFQELAKINFVQSPSDADVELGELQTADGYELFYITQDIQNLNYENEVFYYKPDFDSIMDEIKNATVFKPSESITNVCVYDIEDWFDEYYMLDYIQDNMDEDEFEAFTNEEEQRYNSTI